MTTSLRIGVIGCGTIAQIMHIPYAKDTPGIELVSIADTHEATLQAVGNRFGISTRYIDWRELLVNDDLDAVLIAHSGSHHDSVIAALEHNKHILVEKPLGWNLREVEAVANVARQSDRVVQLGYHKLYDPAFDYTKRQIAEIPDLAYVENKTLHASDDWNKAAYPILRGDTLHQGDYSQPTYEDLITANRNGLAGGVLAPLADEALGDHKDNPQLRLAYGFMTISVIHQIYTLFGFLGAPDEILHAEVWRNGMSIHILMAYPNDLKVALNWQNLPFLNRYQEEYSFYGNSRRVRMTLPGPYYRNFPSPVTIEGGDGELSWEKTVTVSHAEAFQRELIAFRDNIHNGTTPISSVDDALAHSRFIQQVFDAFKS
jgi:predicted dehydrogenase